MVQGMNQLDNIYAVKINSLYPHKITLLSIFLIFIYDHHYRSENSHVISLPMAKFKLPVGWKKHYLNMMTK